MIEYLLSFLRDTRNYFLPKNPFGNSIQATKNLIEHFSLKKNNKPLKNLEILDLRLTKLDCFRNPMSRLGANVTGIDASKNNI